jgi:hypothetical protein
MPFVGWYGAGYFSSRNMQAQGINGLFSILFKLPGTNFINYKAYLLTIASEDCIFIVNNPVISTSIEMYPLMIN